MGRQPFNSASDEHAVPSRLMHISWCFQYFLMVHSNVQMMIHTPKKKTAHLFNPNPRDRPKHANGREHANSSMFQFHCPSSIKVLLGAVTSDRWIFGGQKNDEKGQVMGRGASAVANGVPEKEWITGTNLLVLWQKMTSWQMFFCVAVWWFIDRLKLLIDTTTGPWRSRRM